MATNLDLDDRLVDEALEVGGRKTKKETVTEALREYIQRRKQARVTALFGTVDYDPKYDYRKQRRRQYAVSADGKRFLLNAVAEGAASAPITVVASWRGFKQP